MRSLEWALIQSLLGENHRPKILSLTFKAHGTKPRLIPWSSCSFKARNIIFINQSGICWITSMRQSVMWAFSIPHRREGPSAWLKPLATSSFHSRPKIIFSCLLWIALLSHPSLYKNLPFGTSPWSILLTGWDAAQFINHLIKLTDL